MQFPPRIIPSQASSLSSFSWRACPLPYILKCLEELRSAPLLLHPSVPALQVLLAQGVGLWARGPSAWQCGRRRRNLTLPLKFGRVPVPCRCLQRHCSFRGRRTGLVSSMGGHGRIFQMRLSLCARALC